MIQIKEQTAPGTVKQSAISNLVFVPIKLTSTSGATETLKAFGPTLFDNTSDLDKAVTDANGTTDELGVKLCKHLINLGFDVLVQAITTDEMSESDWNNLRDLGLYDIRFLTNGALKNKNIVTNMINAAAARGDAIALCDFDEQNEEFEWSVDNICLKFSGASNNGEYAGGFTPWFYTTTSDLLVGDHEEELIPPAFGYLFAYANSLKTYPEWFAIAGPERGAIPELTAVAHEYGSADRKKLQSRAANLDDPEDNGGVAINPIANIRPSGYIIDGNRTLKLNQASVGLTPLSFLNVRNGVNAIKKVLYEAGNKYKFAQNNDTLWTNYKGYVTPLLDRMMSGGGLNGYKFTKVATTAKARLSAKLTILPVEAVEDFDILVYMTDDITAVSE